MRAGLRGVLALLSRILAPVPWTVCFGVLFTAMAATLLLAYEHGWAWFHRLAELSSDHVARLTEAGAMASVEAFRLAALGGGLVLGAVALVGFRRRPETLLVQRFGLVVYGLVMAGALMLLVRLPALLFSFDADGLDKMVRNDLWIQGVWLWLALLLPGVVAGVCLHRGRVVSFYGGGGDLGGRWGDRVVEDLRTHGRDPTFRVSAYWAAFIHLFILFLYPLFLRGCGMERPYAIPKGQGQPKMQVVKVKPVKKKKKKYILNLNSPIIFHIPDIDESEILKEVEEMTKHEYQASDLQGIGKGGPGKGGWPDGMENAEVRFIRLEYRGGDWDQDMGKGADYNVLLKFRELTGFRIAPNTESLPILRLQKFPKHRAPPFVFITGRGNISVSREELKVLRWYCLEEGGMIFADNGGGNFNASFRRLVRALFPKLPLVDVPNDDPLYRVPNVFPNGAPPFWHHSGKRALGVKHEGRWVVYYHQGDINDAWKDGHSGKTPAQAKQAYLLAVNIMYHAFTNYLAHHFGE